MDIDIRLYTKDELIFIKDKITNLGIDYKNNNDKIIILSDIDLKTFHYLVDFSKI